VSASHLPEELLACRARHAGRQVLLAEDNRVNQQVAVALLQAAELAVEVVEDGQAAVDWLQAGGRCDLVLMDVQMPVLDGLGATRAIRLLPGRERLPILAMTAHAFDHDHRNCLAAGMDDHLSKPIDPVLFYAKLTTWLDRSG
jgi:CheY-like chemotaxis protein